MYEQDKAVASLVKDMDDHTGDFNTAAKPGYSQLYFPYNSKYINQIDVGKIQTLPTGGKVIGGKHTNESCAMNAALIYNEKNSPSLNSNYENGMQYKFTVGTTKKTGMYSKILPFPLEDVPITYPITIELTGLMLPGGGGKGKIVLDQKYPIGTKTISVWLGMNSAMCTKDNAFVRYDNGVETETQNSKSEILFFKNTYMPIVVKYVANSESDVRFYTDKDTLPFVFVTNSNIVVDYSIAVSNESEKFGNPVYYNFQEEDGKCTVYDTRNKNIDINLLENADNYGEYIVDKIVSIKLNDAVEFVGLNELGVLTQYYLDPATILKSEPVKDMNGGRIEANNRGKGGMNLKRKYTMVLDDGVKKFNNTNTKFAFPIEEVKKRNLVENKNWKKTIIKSNLEYIDNLGQIDRGLLTPSMRITKTVPLFSKDYKLKMELETTGGETYLKIKNTTKNPNSLVSIIPGFMFGKLFVADENEGVNKMYLVGDEITKRYDWTKYDNYGPKKDSLYEITKDKGDCARKASAKSHYFVEKGKCYVPTAEQSMNGYDFVPKSGASLYTPTRALAENPEKYKHYANAYYRKEYAHFDLAKDKWNVTQTLSNQNDSYNDANNYTNDQLGLNSQSNITGDAQVMPNIDGFAERTLQQRTQDQITNRIDPLFNSYLNAQSDVNRNANDIKQNIDSIGSKYAVMSNTVTETSSVKNNRFYDFTDTEIYSLQEDRSLVPALLKDHQTMIMEHNKLYIISTITVATLLISSIFVSSNL